MTRVPIEAPFVLNNLYYVPRYFQAYHVTAFDKEKIMRLVLILCITASLCTGCTTLRTDERSTVESSSNNAFVNNIDNSALQMQAAAIDNWLRESYDHKIVENINAGANFCPPSGCNAPSTPTLALRQNTSFSIARSRVRDQLASMSFVLTQDEPIEVISDWLYKDKINGISTSVTNSSYRTQLIISFHPGETDSQVSISIMQINETRYTTAWPWKPSKEEDIEIAKKLYLALRTTH